MEKCACIETLFTEISFLDRFQAAKDAGFDSVEFWSWTNKDLDRVKAASEKADIRITTFCGDQEHSLNDMAQRKPYLEFVRRSVGAAEKLGTRMLMIHSNALGGGHQADPGEQPSYERRLFAMYDGLRELAPIAEKAGVVLVLEALNVVTDHKGYFLQTTQMGAEMVETLNSPGVRLLYDMYHMQLNEGKICDTLSRYIGDIAHVHVADVPGRHEPGTGEINFPHVLGHLERLGYGGSIGYELYPRADTAAAVKTIMSL